ncbi:hypothetical protein, partial [Inquilinus sp. OTU3971]|uniref:hypothetical protein n=1 Tax=Inquilinus sp. OTU3971 TaxID=3043855 RepID=UPI00313DA82C
RDLFRTPPFEPTYPFYPPPPLAGGGRGRGLVPPELMLRVTTGPAEILANAAPAPVIDTPSPYPLPQGEGESGKHVSVQVIEF